MKKSIIIKGALGTYKVKWVRSGFTYAVPAVYVPKGFLKLLDRKVWEGRTEGIDYVQKMHPCDMKYWFVSAVEEYEEYLNAWVIDTPCTSEVNVEQSRNRKR